MELWHFLSEERLEQKIKFASQNGGQLLLTAPSPNQDISNGILGAFLYCVSHPAGGALFASDESLRVIKIKLHEKAKIFTHVGNPDEIPYRELQPFHAIDMRVVRSKAWPIGFRQLLLLNNEAVEYWSSEKSEYESAFAAQVEKLAANLMDPSYFFMTDFLCEEQLAMASLIAHRIGLNLAGQLPQAEAAARVETALQRIGAV